MFADGRASSRGLTRCAISLCDLRVVHKTGGQAMGITAHSHLTSRALALAPNLCKLQLSSWTYGLVVAGARGELL